jgi:peptidoglycan hydrolase CwlO-like protein
VDEDEINALQDERDDLARKVEELEAKVEEWTNWAYERESMADQLSRDLSNHP